MVFSTVRNAAVLTNGWHTFQITEVETMFGQKGQYLRLTCSLMKNDVATTSHLYKNLFFSESSRFYLEQFMDCLNLPESEDFDSDQLKGCKFKGLISKETDGKYFEFVEFATAETKTTSVVGNSNIKTITDPEYDVDFMQKSTAKHDPKIWA